MKKGSFKLLLIPHLFLHIPNLISGQLSCTVWGYIDIVRMRIGMGRRKLGRDKFLPVIVFFFSFPHFSDFFQRSNTF